MIERRVKLIFVVRQINVRDDAEKIRQPRTY